MCQAYGIPAALAKNNREAERLAQEMLQSPRPYVLVCRVDPETALRCERKGYSMKYTLSVLVENQPGVLSKVVSLFARRGYNIDSLAVGTTEDPTMSRMTIVARGTDHILEQVEKQLNKVIPSSRCAPWARRRHRGAAAGQGGLRPRHLGEGQPDCRVDESRGGRLSKSMVTLKYAGSTSAVKRCWICCAPTASGRLPAPASSPWSGGKPWILQVKKVARPKLVNSQ